MKKIALINPENVPEEVSNNYPVRKAARAVVIDDKNNIALLYVSKENYYKLPGGGVKGSEDIVVALERECIEEIGSRIEVIREIGFIIEFRKSFALKQVSFCYFAKQIGEKGTPSYTEEELENRFKLLWLPYNEALELLTTNTAKNEECRNYIVPRDLTILKVAKEHLL